eukprot:13776580-Alexandrium_andersonii.AAC.1
MASGPSLPSGNTAPYKQSSRSWRAGPSDWNADISDGEESSYAIRVPDDADAASEASAQVSKASGSPNVQQPPKKQAKTEAYESPAERGW